MKLLMKHKNKTIKMIVYIYIDIYLYILYICLDPKTMKKEGFTPPNHGLYPFKMKVVGSHGMYSICTYK